MGQPNKYIGRNYLKTYTLKSIDAGFNSSKNIFSNINAEFATYHDYREFTRNLWNLTKRGYVSRSGKKPNYEYKLTMLGKQHSDDPLVGVHRRMDNFNKKVRLWIEQNSDEYQRMLMNMASEEIKSQGYSIPPAFIQDTAGTDFGNCQDDNAGSIGNIDKTSNTDKLRIKRLENELQKLKNENAEILEQKELLKDHIKYGTGSVKLSDNNLKLANTRKKLTHNYLTKYNGELDLNFFKEWGIYPCLLKGTTIYNKASIDIISKSNEEFQRGHVKRELSDGEIIKAQLRISKYDKNGIWVNGQGLNKPKLLKFDRYSRTTRTPKPKQQTKTGPQPQINIRAPEA